MHLPFSFSVIQKVSELKRVWHLDLCYLPQLCIFNSEWEKMNHESRIEWVTRYHEIVRDLTVNIASNNYFWACKILCG